MNQTTWSSPQSMSTDEFDNYSYRGQAVQSAYNPASLSPRSWPSSTQTPPPVQASQYELPIRSQDPAFGLANDHLTMSPETLCGTDLNVSLHYSNSGYPHGFEQRHFDPEPLQRTLESDRVHYASSPGTDAPGSPYGGSPTSFHVGDLPDVIPDLGGQSPSTKANPQPDAANNNSEGPPYAKLIHRALKNAPDHSMTLQELYKWFRDNTNKPQRTEKNGWQNSIRHNLSMNDVSAFACSLAPRHSSRIMILPKKAPCMLCLDSTPLASEAFASCISLTDEPLFVPYLSIMILFANTTTLI